MHHHDSGACIPLHIFTTATNLHTNICLFLVKSLGQFYHRAHVLRNLLCTDSIGSVMPCKNYDLLQRFCSPPHHSNLIKLLYLWLVAAMNTGNV